MRRTLITMMLGCTMESGMDPFTSAGPGSSGQDTTGTTLHATEGSGSDDTSGSTAASSSSGDVDGSEDASSSGEPPVDECPHDVVGKGACPGECTGGCDDGRCHIACTVGGSCSDASIACPDGW